MHNYLVIEQTPSISPHGVFFLDSPIANTLGQPFTDYGGGIFPFRHVRIGPYSFVALSHITACTYNGKAPNPLALQLTGRDFYADVLFAPENEGNLNLLLGLLNLKPEDIPVI